MAPLYRLPARILWSASIRVILNIKIFIKFDIIDVVFFSSIGTYISIYILLLALIIFFGQKWVVLDLSIYFMYTDSVV